MCFASSSSRKPVVDPLLLLISSDLPTAEDAPPARRGETQDRAGEPSKAKDEFASFWENGPSDLVESKTEEVDVKMEETQSGSNGGNVSSNVLIIITCSFFVPADLKLFFRRLATKNTVPSLLTRLASTLFV